MRWGLGKNEEKWLERIGKRVMKELFILKEMRKREMEIMKGESGERIGDKGLLLESLRKEKEFRERIVIIEMRKEREKKLRWKERNVGFRKIGEVEKVMEGEEEEEMNEGNEELMMDGEKIGLIESLRIDKMMGMEVWKRGEKVEIEWGMLKIEIGGRWMNWRWKMIIERMDIEGKKGNGIWKKKGIVIVDDLIGEGRREEFDMIEKEGKCEGLKEGIGEGEK